MQSRKLLFILNLFAPLCGSICATAQGFSPQESPSQMSLPADLQVQLVASEPMIAQPVCIEFDDRGRLWVMQYLQYPNPAGLKRSVVDRWSRTTYDRVPEPPPHGPKGADRITILEDTDGDGRADKAHDFVNGLNLANGLAFGHGGVFVLNVPYLLFYPDRNGDDIPDSDPIVCLSGFGMEDAHSIANSLTWGPDGWLYGCQGSTVTAHIRGIEFQQGIWRYHPLTHEFELFCEGGGNSWGLDFDDEGELIYSTNLGPYRNLHGVQGAYYWKSFGKHGALHNPYAFGYFDHIPHTNFTGGHVTDGGIIYQGTNLPARFQNRYVCGDLLGHGVQWHEMYRWGSTFTSSHGGYLLEANDKWFASTDVTMSPDGAVYVADWYDQRTAHPDPDADWDRSNGRVYRISAKGTKPAPVPDLRKFSTPQLIALLGDRNDWIVRKARRVLADRRDPEAILPLRSLVLETLNDHLALEALWALYVSGGFNEAFAAKALDHRYAPIRKWTIRLLGDEKHVSPLIAARLTELAKSDPDVRVRMQLASSAQRLPANQALPIIETLLVRDSDGNDPYLPLLLWWAVERHAIAALPDVERFFTSPTAWKSGLVRNVIQERLMRRWMAEGSTVSYDAGARLLASAPDDAQRQRLLAALDQGFHDRPAGSVGFGSGGLFASTAVTEVRTNRTQTHVERVTPALNAQLDSLWRDDTTDPVLIRVAARTGRENAVPRARALLADANAKPELRLNLIQMLGELGKNSDAERLLKLVGDAPESLQLAALDALPDFDMPTLPAELLQRYPKLGDRVRARVRQVLLSRKPWAAGILRAVDSGRLQATDFAVEQLRVVALHGDRELNDLVRKHWGKMSSGTAEEKLAEMRRLNNDLNVGPGDPARGHEIFTKVCGVCHTMFGEGGKIGPDLTTANRADREFLLGSIVDPSAAIRKEFLAYEVETKDERVVSGVIVDQSSGNLTLGIVTGERVVIPQVQVTAMRESAISIMPEGLVKPLNPRELRDLFSFLQSANKVASK
ncbi:MAG: c-type cytochrome [Verrucomicrobia bacterium]|nr:c-type cytochrome [Verrucomicrobiota bacterium]